MAGLGVYIHVPFCAAKCKYCAFVSERADKDKQQQYISRVLNEINGYKEGGSNVPADSIYIGGGTPSILYSGGIASLMDGVRRSVGIADGASVTAEANPDSLTGDKAKEFAESGINRISIGLQSADDRVTSNAGRIHTLIDFERAVGNAVKAGIKDISCDIMLGLPYDSLEGLRRTISIISSMGVITHVSAYGLKAEEGTPWQSLEVDEDLAADMYDCTVAELNALGYYRYEVSNFARKGYKSTHNLKYWTGGDYLGVGAAAHSLLNGVRLANPDSIKDYMSGKKAVSTVLTDEDREKEYIMLRLRLERGIDTNEYKQLFGSDFASKYRNELDWLRRYSLVITDGGSVRVAPDKFGVLNQIIVKFF